MFLRSLVLAGLMTGVLVAAQSKPQPAPAQPPIPPRATTADPDKPVTETKHLTISVSSSARSAARGGKLSLFVDVAPKPKMHVYAPDQKDYIPISLTLKADESVRVEPVQFPAAETYFFAPLKETQRVYGKPFRIVQPVTLGKQLQGDSLTITGTVRYQACDDAICYVPQNIAVAWTIAVK